MCGGITENLFIHYDFKVPFEDLRYCGKCNGFFKVVIRAAHAIPEFHVLPKGLTLPFVSGLVATIVAGVRKKKCPTQ